MPSSPGSHSTRRTPAAPRWPPSPPGRTSARRTASTRGPSTRRSGRASRVRAAACPTPSTACAPRPRPAGTPTAEPAGMPRPPSAADPRSTGSPNRRSAGGVWRAPAACCPSECCWKPSGCAPATRPTTVRGWAASGTWGGRYPVLRSATRRGARTDPCPTPFALIAEHLELPERVAPARPARDALHAHVASPRAGRQRQRLGAAGAVGAGMNDPPRRAVGGNLDVVVLPVACLPAQFHIFERAHAAQIDLEPLIVAVGTAPAGPEAAVDGLGRRKTADAGGGAGRPALRQQRCTRGATPPNVTMCDLPLAPATSTLNL